jgi:hypothetical protein
LVSYISHARSPNFATKSHFESSTATSSQQEGTSWDNQREEKHKLASQIEMKPCKNLEIEIGEGNRFYMTVHN